MKRKIYKLLASAKQSLFALALLVFSGTGYAQTTYTFNYTGIVQTISLPPGTYSVHCWGANGGKGFQTSQIANNGKGGYSTGLITLTAAQTISVYVGGMGTDANGTTVGQICAGGFNGGGSSGANNYATLTSYRAGGGGGGSDIRVGGPALTDRVIVAGGGGGGIYSATLGGGNGGGITGANGGNTYNGAGGSQTAGGTANGSAGNIAGTNGALGIGGDGGTAASKSGGGGGGGGYYGGGGGATGNTSSSQGSGGGGSGYIGGVTSATTIMFGQTNFVANPDVTGNGRIHITELCSISLSVTGLNANGAMCAGNSVTITTNAVANYSWSTGATTSSIVLSPTSNTVISLTAQSASLCTASASATLLVSQGVPTLNVVNSTSGNGFGVCPNNPAILTASGANTYTWTGSVTNALTFTPIISSSYMVTGENGCGTGTAVTSVSIHPSPTVSPIGVSSPSMCTGTSNTLTASGLGVATFSWSTGTVSTSIVVSPSSNTTYTVKGTSVEGCTNTAVTIVTVFAAPLQVPVANPSVICLGESSSLTAVGTTFTWLPGGSSNALLVVTPVISGVFIYTVTKANGACSDTKTLAVTVNSVPVIFAQANPTVVCASVQSATLTANGGTSYTWAPSGGNNTTALVTASINTIYTLTGTDGNCASTNTVMLDVNPLPIILPTASTPSICAGEVLTLSVTGANSYTWSPGGPFPSLTISPTITTQYNVVGTSSVGCDNAASITVTVSSVPALFIANNNPAVCLGSPAEMSVIGADTYTWSDNTSASSATFFPTQSTQYSVTGTFTNSNCSTTQTVMVDVFTPSVTISGNTTICEGNTATLTADAIGAISYSWSTGLPIQSILVSPTITSLYVVTATVSGFNIACVAVDNIQVVVKPKPSIFVNADVLSLCVNEQVSVSAFGGTAYVWSWGLQTATSPSIVITPSVSNNLVVNVKGTDANGCSNTGSITLMVNACTGISEYNISDNLQVYPNPSQGEINVSFISAAELMLISETGQMIRKISLSEENEYKAIISDLSNGIYFITGQNGSQRINKKIIINK